MWTVCTRQDARTHISLASIWSTGSSPPPSCGGAAPAAGGCCWAAAASRQIASDDDEGKTAAITHPTSSAPAVSVAVVASPPPGSRGRRLWVWQGKWMGSGPQSIARKPPCFFWREHHYFTYLRTQRGGGAVEGREGAMAAAELSLASACLCVRACVRCVNVRSVRA